MSDVLLKPAFQSGVLDSGDATKLGPTAWNAARLFSGGNDGEICVRSTASATGAAWLTPSALKTSLALVKADVGLSAVENTALSTWGGSANLTTFSANVPLKNAANVFTVEQSITKDALAAVSTDALILQNTTLSTAGVPVQQSPRLRLRGHVWNTTTPATNTADVWMDTTPVSGAFPTAPVALWASINGAAAIAATFIVGRLSLSALGDAITLGPAASASRIFGPANGTINITNGANNAGVGFDFATDGTLKIRTRAQTGDASLTALNITANGTLSVLGGGDITTQGGLFVGAAQRIGWLNLGGFAASGNGLFLIRTNGTTEGVGLDVVTDTILKVRTRAHTGYATVDALAYKASGVAGISFGPAHPASITIVNGIVTAAS